MCGRYAFTQSSDSVSKAYQAMLDEVDQTTPWPHGRDLRPTNRVCVIRSPETGKRTIKVMEWGLIPRWVKKREDWKATTFNAKSETLLEKPTFKKPFLEGLRCLVIADGYYEWRDEGSKRKQKYYFRSKDGASIAMAGLYDVAKLKEVMGEDTHYSCTIITCPPNEVTGEYHDRMPVILDPSVQDKWLAYDTPTIELQALLVPPSDDYLRIDKRDPREEEEKRRAENPELF
jgi:putative SOS response-associated peptidase YedK